MNVMAHFETSGSHINFDTSWDVNKYYNPLEPLDHWELKKKFMEKNKHKFPEPRLVCLATTFVNVEVLCCWYNPQTMKLLEELSKGVVEEFREKKRQRIQKVFVKASDAAASKIRAGKSDAKAPFKELIRTAAQARTGLERAFSGGAAGTLSTVKDVEMHQPQGQNQSMNKPRQGLKNSKGKIDKGVPQTSIPKECQTCYGNFVLVEDEGVNIVPKHILERSSSLCQASMCVKEERSAENEMIVSIAIRDKFIASAKDVQAKKARELAFQSALEKLQEVCYTIKIKNRQYSDGPVGKDFVEANEEKGKEPGNSGAIVEAEVCDETQKEEIFSSKALKMMANMGWTGGGLGKSQQGITEPIRVQTTEKRGGIGSKAKRKNQEKEEELTEKSLFKKRAVVFLEKYANTDTEKDLIFATEFTNEERKILHQLSSRFELKSRSYGKKDRRHLVISKKIDPFALVRNLLTPGYKSEKFELVKPTGPTIVVID